MREINMRNIEAIMNLYSELDEATGISNRISFEAVCNLDNFDLMALYATLRITVVTSSIKTIFNKEKQKCIKL